MDKEGTTMSQRRERASPEIISLHSNLCIYSIFKRFNSLGKDPAPVKISQISYDSLHFSPGCLETIFISIFQECRGVLGYTRCAGPG